MAWITPTSVYDSCGQETGYEATKSIDGDTETFWTHDYSGYHYIIYDLGASKEITKIRLYQHAVDAFRWGCALGVRVRITDNPEIPGSVVWEGVLNEIGWVESGAFFKKGRYVVIQSKSNGWEQTLFEFEAYELEGPPFQAVITKSDIYGDYNWLQGWNRRKKQTITGTTKGTQTNYQMKMTVHKGSGSDSATDVYCGGNCRDDFGDIRWTQSDGITLLDYWIQEVVSGDYAIFWIEIKTIPGSPSTVSIFMYYDNSSATSLSDGEATFRFFDHFLGDSIDTSKWDTEGTPVVADSIVTLETYPCSITEKTLDFNSPSRLMARGKIGTSGRGHIGQFSEEEDFKVCFQGVGDIHYAWYFYGGLTRQAFAIPTGSWYIYRLDLGKSSSQNFYVDDALKVDWTVSVPFPAPMGPISWVYDEAGSKVEIDWFLVANLSDPEPTWGTWGSEIVYPAISIRKFQLQNVLNYSCNHFEDNRPSKWTVVLGKVKGTDIDLYNGADELEVKRESALLFRGPMENISYDAMREELELSGRGMEQFLARQYVSSHPDAVYGRLTYSIRTVPYIVEDLLRGTSINLGTVDSSYNTATASFRFDFISVLEAINQVAEAYGARYWVDENKDLWFKPSRGETAPVWLKENILVSRKTTDYTRLINRLTVLGSGDGLYQRKQFVQDDSSQIVYGTRDGVETRRDIIDNDVLISYGQKLLDIVSEPTITFEIVIPWTKEIQIGDIVKVTDSKTNLDGNFKVVELQIMKSTAGGDELKLSFSNKVGRFEQLEYWTRLRTLEKTARGSSLSNLFPNYISAETDLTTNFYIPEEVEEATGLLSIEVLVHFNWTGAGDASLFVDDVDRTDALNGPWGMSPQENIDISEWITTTGWHTIKVHLTEAGNIRSLVKTKVFLYQ